METPLILYQNYHLSGTASVNITILAADIEKLTFEYVPGV